MRNYDVALFFCSLRDAGIGPTLPSATRSLRRGGEVVTDMKSTGREEF